MLAESLWLLRCFHGSSSLTLALTLQLGSVTLIYNTLHQTRSGVVQADNKVHDAWANVKGKQPLNRRHSQHRSSSDAQGQMQAQQSQPQQPQSQQHQPQPDQQFKPSLNHQLSQNRNANRESDNSQPSSRGNSRPEDTLAGFSAPYEASRMQSEAGMPASTRSMQGIAGSHGIQSCMNNLEIDSMPQHSSACLICSTAGSSVCMIGHC